MEEGRSRSALAITADPTLTEERQREVLERVRLMFQGDGEVRVKYSGATEQPVNSIDWAQQRGYVNLDAEERIPTPLEDLNVREYGPPVEPADAGTLTHDQIAERWLKEQGMK